MKKILISSLISLFAVTGVSAAYFDHSPAPVCGIQITANLSQGSTHPEVYILQGLLKRAGYLHAIPNGTFGAQTKAAVKAFQRDNYISATGTVGPTTRNALNERMCDQDLSMNSYGGYSYNGYSSGVTYVDAQDPFVQVITPSSSYGTVYNNPGTTYASNFQYGSGTAYATPVTSTYSTPAIPQVGSANIIYSPYVGYTYGITPLAGSLTITSPNANSGYNEGDTVSVSWSTNNLSSVNNHYIILLESANTRQNRVVTTTTSNNASFTLTKEILDAICSGACDFGYNQTGQYRVVITTPVTDMAGISSTFKAGVNVTIKRPFAYKGNATISPNKTPVNSGETFRMFVNMPNSTSVYGTPGYNFTFKLRAICPGGTMVSIAGVQCGGEFTLPYAYSNQQQEVPVTISNTIYYQQNVVFELTTYSPTGSEVSKTRTNVTVNGVPFNY